eukprot:COSAG02_NODE_28138_length_595_cov_1.280242_1_plen_44_part_10
MPEWICRSLPKTVPYRVTLFMVTVVLPLTRVHIYGTCYRTVRIA